MPTAAMKNVLLQGEGHSRSGKVKSLFKTVGMQWAGWHQIGIGSKNQRTKRRLGGSAG